MCGIAGFDQSEPQDQTTVAASMHDLSRRGPDQSRAVFFQNGQSSDCGPLGLLHTRLSIRDLSDAGAQPMSNADGSVWIVFNGEIYGWQEQRKELEAAGYVFSGSSDTEFVLHGYAMWGEEVLDRMRGMFAFAILDFRRKHIFCARDRLGKKPFYYCLNSEGFAFASTLKALMGLHTQTSFSINPMGLDAYLAHRYLPAPLTLLQGVHKLPAGHSLSVPLSAKSLPSPRPYWHAEATDPTTFERHLRESVQLRLESDRPIGLFLSDGIDSTAVAQLLADAGHHERLIAMTAGFPDYPSADESQPAAQTARRLGFQHIVLPIRFSVDDLPEIIADLDEPFADPSAIPTWYLCREATQHVKVVLNGDGGDELFAGYKRYAKHARAPRMRPFRSAFLRDYLVGDQFPAGKKTTRGRMQRLLLEASCSWEDAYALRFSGFDYLQRYALFAHAKECVAPSHLCVPPPSSHPLRWMADCDRQNYLPEYILKKSDLCGMAHGLELRSPLMDHHVLASVLGMRDAERFTQPAKQALRQLITVERAQGPKRGFNPPLRQWLQDPQMRERLNELPQRLPELTGGLLSSEALEGFLTAVDTKTVSSELVWQLYVLQISLTQLSAAAPATATLR